MDEVIGDVTQVLLQQLYESIKNQGQSTFRFKSEFEKMEKKLEIMTSFVSDAQLQKRNHNNYMTVKKLLPQLRDLVYDADDIVVDCQIRADYEHDSSLHRYTLPGRVFRHNAKNQLRQINRRIEDMENQLKTYLNPISGIGLTSNEGSGRRVRRTSHAPNLYKTVGLSEHTQKIIGWIETNAKSCRIGIVGMGGLGKTTIAREIFNDTYVVGHFDERIWLSVSQTFSYEGIETSMLKQLRVDGIHANDRMSLIQQSLNNKKYLIVLDDVWSIEYDWWNMLCSYLPEGGKCTKIIMITTRNENVAKSMGVAYVHKARSLNENDSWSLFCDVAFSENKDISVDSEFGTLGKEIVMKCEGLPLAIKTIAGLLSTKVCLHQWKEVSTNFRHELDNNTSVSATLQLSYDDLPPDLKHCILCFSIYPEDTVISAEQLVYWWVGEGFVHGKGPNTSIEVAFQYLLELVNRCLVEVVKQRGYDGRVYTCKMHDMVRDLIIKMSKEEAFSSFDGTNKHKPDVNSRHLGYTVGMNEKLLENNSKLHAFLLMESCSFSFQRGSGLATVKSLRVLDLSQNKLAGIMSVTDLLSWIKSQKRLAYLNLRGVGHLKELPDWIKKRQNLKILVITECNNLKSLNPLVTTLQNLVVLDVEKCSLENLPRGLGKLTKLQVLSGFKLASPGEIGARLGDLKDLTGLRVLRINLSKKDKMADGEVGCLSELRQLKVLSIDTKDCGKEQVLLVNKLVPPPSLEELHLRSYHGDTTPDWVSPSFLPELLFLYIDDGQLTSVSHGFWSINGKPWKIEGLCFKHLPRFKLEWEDIQSNMKYLRYVEISNCPGLPSFPCDVEDHGIWEKK